MRQTQRSPEGPRHLEGRQAPQASSAFRTPTAGSLQSWAGKQKKAGVAILISDKIDLKILTRDKEGHYIMTKGSIQEEDITIINIYAPNIEASQYIRQTLTDIKGEIDRNTIIVDLNTPLTPVNRSSKHKSNNQTRLK